MHQRKILLLENAATQTAGARERFSGVGFDVAVSCNEADALKRLVEWGPDVVLISTDHPAGDVDEYCRRVRNLAPAVRIVVTSTLNSSTLFQEHPGLQTIVDGVLLRPYGPEEVTALLAPAPVAPAADPGAEPGSAALRADFQRQIDDRFLEIQRLKHDLAVATKRIAPAQGLERLQSENEHLRRGVEETRKKFELALAMEQLKRSEIEVKLEDLLRMKEASESRAQNEIEDRSREVELARGQLQELRERSDRETGEHAALRVEMERVLVGNEQFEERLLALEAEVSRQRALAAEARTALDAATERRSTLEKELADVQAARAGEQGIVSDLHSRFTAAESSAAAALTALAAEREDRAALAKDLAEAQEARAGDARLAQELRSEFTERTREVLERAVSAEHRNELLQAGCAELEKRLRASEAARSSVAAEVVEQCARAEQLSREVESLGAFKAEAEVDSRQAARSAEIVGRELAESRDRSRELAAECERLTGMLQERERLLAEEVRTGRDRAEAAALEIRLLQSQGAERAGREENERRTAAERHERSGRELAEKELQLATLRAELAAAMEAHRTEVRDLETRGRESETESREVSGRLERAEAALVAAREGCAARERELRLQLEAQQASHRELEEKLAARSVQELGAATVQVELHRIQELLEDVISRARIEAVDYARREAELSTRLQAALDERRLLQERFDRASAEATERERRSSSLLQSAIDRGPARPAELFNLPAIVPLEPGPRSPRLKPALVGLAVVALAALLAVIGLRRTTPPAVREQQPAIPQQQTGAIPGGAATPRDVWDRWTRSDSSGGVLVQATLRSEQELRAEVEAERARGLSDEEVRAELARRLSLFRFDTTYYVSVYLKNLAPGYPAYLDNLPGSFRLRDSSGREVPAYLPPGHEKDLRIFSFGAGPPGDLIHEAAVSLGFDRDGLSPSPAYLQLVVSDVGAASRRVLTWELE